jgi:hypothetical protein
MGVAISKNTVNSMVQNVQSVIRNYENICEASGNEAQTQFNSNGCTYKNTQINISATQNISQKCISSDTTYINMSNDVKQSMQQTAQAITQSFGFPSFSDAETFINTSVRLGQSIVDQYRNICISRANSAESIFTCTKSNFDGSTINLQSYQQITQQCELTSNDTINLRSSLEVQLSQSSLAQQQNTFAIFAVIIIVIIIVLAYAGISVATSPLVEWGIVALVAISIISSVIYTISAQKYGNYPYTKP